MRVRTIISVGVVIVGAYFALVIVAFFAASTQQANTALIAVLGALAGALGGIVSGALTAIVTAWVQERQNTEKLRDRVSAHALELTRLDYDLRLRALNESGEKQLFLAPAKVYRELYRALELLHRENEWPISIQELGLLQVFEFDPFKKARREDLSKQHSRLLEFLSELASEFRTLQSIGHTHNEQWRREKAQGIREWVERHKPQFPQHVQEALTGIMNLAGTAVDEQGLKVAQQPEAFQKSGEWLDTVKKYVNELKAELYGMA